MAKVFALPRLSADPFWNEVDGGGVSGSAHHKAKGIVIRPPLPLGPCFAVSSFSPFLPSFPPLPRLLSFSYSPLLLPYSSCSFNIHYITILFFISIDNPPPTVSRLNSQPFHTILIIRMNVNIR